MKIKDVEFTDAEMIELLASRVENWSVDAMISFIQTTIRINYQKGSMDRVANDFSFHFGECSQYDLEEVKKVLKKELK